MWCGLSGATLTRVAIEGSEMQIHSALALARDCVVCPSISVRCLSKRRRREAAHTELVSITSLCGQRSAQRFESPCSCSVAATDTSAPNTHGAEAQSSIQGRNRAKTLWRFRNGTPLAGWEGGGMDEVPQDVDGEELDLPLNQEPGQLPLRLRSTMRLRGQKKNEETESPRTRLDSDREPNDTGGTSIARFLVWRPNGGENRPGRADRRPDA